LPNLLLLAASQQKAQLQQQQQLQAKGTQTGWPGWCLAGQGLVPAGGACHLCVAEVVAAAVVADYPNCAAAADDDDVLLLHQQLPLLLALPES
jgi:hypothetical protein